MRSKSRWYLASIIPVALAAIAGAPAPANLDVPKALAAQRDLVAASPTSAAAQVDLGNLLLLDGRSADAEAAYRQAIVLDPASVNAHFDLGLLLQQSNKTRDAAREFKRVLELDPNHAWAHYQLGVLREEEGAESAAVRSYAKAFALDPRLAFPDVNPHVLENKLVTQAMLRAYDRELPPMQRGAAYEDPTRIASLLVGSRAGQAAGAGQPAAGQAGATPRPDSIAEPAAGSAAPQTLRPGDLSQVGAAGQATAPGAATRRGGTRPVIVGEEGSEERELEIYEPPVPTLRIPTPTEPSTGVVPYQPGLPSTGRLEMHLRDAWGREIGRG